MNMNDRLLIAKDAVIAICKGVGMYLWFNIVFALVILAALLGLTLLANLLRSL